LRKKLAYLHFKAVAAGNDYLHRHRQKCAHVGPKDNNLDQQGSRIVIASNGLSPK